MTSTSFNVGLADGRNSSRVLKPPGGGHTDIFTGDNADNQPPQKIIPKSEIGQCFIAENIEVPPKQETKQKEENGKEPADENAKPAEPKNDQPKRVRVPPGGFSSGFW